MGSGFHYRLRRGSLHKGLLPYRQHFPQKRKSSAFLTKDECRMFTGSFAASVFEGQLQANASLDERKNSENL